MTNQDSPSPSDHRVRGGMNQAVEESIDGGPWKPIDPRERSGGGYWSIEIEWTTFLMGVSLFCFGLSFVMSGWMPGLVFLVGGVIIAFMGILA